MTDGLAKRTTIFEERVVAVTLECPTMREALRGAAKQPSSELPVRYLLGPDGRPRMRAEIPRVLADVDCEKLAHEAIEAALLGPLCDPPEAEWRNRREQTRVDGRDASELEDAPAAVLDEHGWPWQPCDGGWRVHVAVGDGPAARLEAERRPDGLHVWADARLRVSSVSLLAQAFYALELNHRLRIARVSVDAPGLDVVHAFWDAFLPCAVPVELALAPMLEAVAFARAVSLRPLAALGVPEMAAAYMKVRFPGQSFQVDAATGGSGRAA